MKAYFITHPEVVIDPQVPVPDWPLSGVGVQRTHAMLGQPWVRDLGAIFCSDERKAVQTATILAEHCELEVIREPRLGENDRSATGYLPPDEFQKVADQFFAEPDCSIRGWEAAAAAQARIVAAVETCLSNVSAESAVAVVSHGGVGALFLCHLMGCAIARSQDQPGGGGGNYYCFDLVTRELLQGWSPIDG